MKILKISTIYLLLGLILILGVFNTFITANLIQSGIFLY